MEDDKDEIQRQARARMQRVSERVQTEKDQNLGAAIAGAKALDWLRVSLEAVANDLGILADGVKEPELGVLVRDRASLHELARVTREGTLLSASHDFAGMPPWMTDDKEEMLDFLMEHLAKRDRTPRHAKPLPTHAVPRVHTNGPLMRRGR